MGDISEMRGLIVVGTFLSVFAILVMFLLASFPGSTGWGDSGKIADTPTYIGAGDVILYNSTNYNVNFTEYAGSDPSYWGYWGITLTFDSAHYLVSAFNTTNYHGYPAQFYAYYAPHYPMSYGLEAMTWTIQNEDYGEKLYWTDLDSLAETYDDLIFIVKASAGNQFTCAFIWDKDTYAKPSEAGEVDQLYITVGRTINQMQSSINAAGLIWSILFFQTPLIHPVINIFIAIPIWICVGYLIFIFALRLIGALFGGGGA